MQPEIELMELESPFYPQNAIISQATLTSTFVTYARKCQHWLCIRNIRTEISNCRIRDLINVLNQNPRGWDSGLYSLFFFKYLFVILMYNQNWKFLTCKSIKEKNEGSDKQLL